MKKNNFNYYPWITQHKPPEVVSRYIEVFAGVLQVEVAILLGGLISVTMLNPLEVPAQIHSFLKGDSHIALMNPQALVNSASKPLSAKRSKNSGTIRNG